MKKAPFDMTTEEILSELEWIGELFEEYEQIGQGISTKETVRQRSLQAELERRREPGRYAIRNAAR